MAIRRGLVLGENLSKNIDAIRFRDIFYKKVQYRGTIPQYAPKFSAEPNTNRGSIIVYVPYIIDFLTMSHDKSWGLYYLYNMNTISVS